MKLNHVFTFSGKVRLKVSKKFGFAATARLFAEGSRLKRLLIVSCLRSLKTEY